MVSYWAICNINGTTPTSLVKRWLEPNFQVIDRLINYGIVIVRNSNGVCPPRVPTYVRRHDFKGRPQRAVTNVVIVHVFFEEGQNTVLDMNVAINCLSNMNFPFHNALRVFMNTSLKKKSNAVMQQFYVQMDSIEKARECLNKWDAFHCPSTNAYVHCLQLSPSEFSPERTSLSWSVPTWLRVSSSNGSLVSQPNLLAEEFPPPKPQQAYAQAMPYHAQGAVAPQPQQPQQHQQQARSFHTPQPAGAQAAGAVRHTPPTAHYKAQAQPVQGQPAPQFLNGPKPVREPQSVVSALHHIQREAGFSMNGVDDQDPEAAGAYCGGTPPVAQLIPQRQPPQQQQQPMAYAEKDMQLKHAQPQHHHPAKGFPADHPHAPHRGAGVVHPSFGGFGGKGAPMEYAGAPTAAKSGKNAGYKGSGPPPQHLQQAQQGFMGGKGAPLQPQQQTHLEDQGKGYWGQQQQQQQQVQGRGASPAVVQGRGASPAVVQSMQQPMLAQAPLQGEPHEQQQQESAGLHFGLPKEQGGSAEDLEALLAGWGKQPHPQQLVQQGPPAETSSASSLSSPYSTKPSLMGSAFSHSPAGTPSGISSASLQTGASSAGLNGNAPPFLAMGQHGSGASLDAPLSAAPLGGGAHANVQPLLRGVNQNAPAVVGGGEDEAAGEIDFSGLILQGVGGSRDAVPEETGGGGLGFDFSGVVGGSGGDGGVNATGGSGGVGGKGGRVAQGVGAAADGESIGFSFSSERRISSVEDFMQAPPLRSIIDTHQIICEAAISDEHHSSSSDRW